MEIFKKISVFIVFFLTLSQGFGNSVSFPGDQLYVVENQDERQSPSEDLLPEFDDQEDGSFIDNYVPCNCISVIKERIYPEAFPFYTSYNFTFWQPPHNF